MSEGTEALYKEISDLCKLFSESINNNTALKKAADVKIISLDKSILSSIHINSLTRESLFATSCKLPASKTEAVSQGLKRSTKKIIWDNETDKILLELLKVYKMDWKRILIRFKKLTHRKRVTIVSLKARYAELSKSKPKFNKNFSTKEDELLIEMATQYGTNWIEIERFFNNRDWFSLKNRYYYLLRKKQACESELKC